MIRGKVFGGAALSTLILGLMCQPVSAALLLPGVGFFPAPSEPDPVGGVLLAQITAPFVTADLQGQVVSQVLSGDLSNPLGGLTFTYQIMMAATSVHAVSAFSVGNYGGFQTDASYLPLAVLGTVAPTLVERSALPGDVVRFSYLTSFGGSIAAGQTSALMVVQTDAVAYQITSASVINSVSAVVSSLAPTAIPEPATATLAILGGLALLRLRWRMTA